MYHNKKIIKNIQPKKKEDHKNYVDAEAMLHWVGSTTYPIAFYSLFFFDLRRLINKPKIIFEKKYHAAFANDG